MSNGTQLNKSLSVGHVIATVGLIVGGFAFIYDLREGVAIQSFQLENVEDRLERVVARTDDQFGEIMNHLIRLEEKLDAIAFDPSVPIYKAR
jgi:membrane carboxypeptidase/penicillin-binding protein|tara:strand:- start:406 stop:681 length:276 start_codon:yes stop_codon:yes gene_type:complete